MDYLELSIRVTRLEESEKRFTERLSHLDAEVAKVKNSMEENMRTWDRRWWLGIGVAVTLALLTGGGSVSLKSLIGAMSK